MTTIANHPHHDMGYLLKPGHSLICRADRMPSPTSRRRGNHADPEPQAMLARLSIRDIVLIDRLDLDFASGLSVLTGETGAGKSILLDAFALALGARGDATLVRQGAEQGQVTAMFELPPKHPARTLLADSDIAADEALILRRVQFADGRTRAFVNDQPVSVQALQALGCMLVEIHGQHDARALVDAGTHRGLLDAYARLEDDADQVDTLWTARRQAADAVTQHRADVERAAREAEWLRHAVAELQKLGPEPGEETALADRRASMMQAEKVAGDLRDAHEAVAGTESPVPGLSAACRRLERRGVQAPGLVEPAVKAIDAALNALEEARGHLEEALRTADYDPHELERIEERLFALRAAGRSTRLAPALLAQAGIEHPPARVAMLSGGMRKRVAVARAMASAPVAARAPAERARVTISAPGTTSGRGPWRSYQRPTRGPSSPIIRPPGIITRPACSTLSPRASCSHRGSRIIAPIMAIMATPMMAMDSAKLRWVRARRSSSGEPPLRARAICRHTSRATPSTPTPSASGGDTNRSVAPPSPPWPPRELMP